MLSGIEIDGEIFKLTDIVEGEKHSTNQWFSVCLMSGKNREIRKILRYFDLKITKLKRIEYGPFQLEKLAVGKLKEIPEKALSVYLKKVKFKNENNFW